MATWSSFAHFQLFHYYSGWPAGLLCKMKIRLTQPSLAGTWAELGNSLFEAYFEILETLEILKTHERICKGYGCKIKRKKS